MKKQNGITLIALVITIIVMLILAGISLNATLGDNGIIQKAKMAKENTDFAKRAEQIEYELYMREAELRIVYLRKYITEDTRPYLPDNSFSVIEGTNLSTGLVITDHKINNVVDGNEYVWVEVPKRIFNLTGKKSEIEESDYEKIYADLRNYCATAIDNITSFISPIGSDHKNSVNNFRDEWYNYISYTYDGEHWYKYDHTLDENYSGNVESKAGCGLTRNEYVEQYKKMLESIYINGGFWIGRYEAGINEARTSRIEANLSPVPLSQPNKSPYTYVTCSDAQIIASTVSNGKKYNSSLLFGIQWDLTCKFLERSDEWDLSAHPAYWYINTDSSSWGNYKTDLGASPLVQTGSLINCKKRNIYDFAGNAFEYTLEHATGDQWDPCTVRGGYCNNTGINRPATDRNSGSPSISSADYRYGFRVSIY